jgi:hypothetical protein
MKQNAFHLIYLFAVFVCTMALPVAIGLIAVFMERSDDSAPKGDEPSVESGA